MSYTSPFSKRQVVNNLACRKFVDMNPLDRQKTLDKKGVYCQCLSPGAKRGHMNCQVKYSCRHQSHGKDGEEISRACM